VLTNQYDGSTKCCGAPGTPPAADPCSILNSPGFLQAQAADVGPIGPNGVPLSSPSFSTYTSSPTNLADIASYPNNVQEDVQTCFTNPGASFVDSVGMQVNCPSAQTEVASGIFNSSYTYAQLAAMLAPSITPSTYLAGNAPFASAPATSAGIVTSGGPQGQISIRLVNSSGGSNSAFNVGDSWQVIVSGPPNSPVTASATQNGTSLGSSPMGTIGSNGQLVLTGTMSASQVGNWTESWSVGGQSAGTISFSVAAPSGSGSSPGGGSPAGSSSGGGSPAGSSSSTSDFLSGSVSVGGVSVPYWALGAGALALFFLMGRK
jgi:hypothetical protein